MRNEEVEQIVRKKGKDGASIFIQAVAKGKHFKKALETPIGQTLLTDLTDNMVVLTEKILNNKDTAESRAELKAFQKILEGWSAKINSADHSMNEFNMITKGV